MRLDDDKRYWLSLAGIVTVTLLVAGTVGGSVALAAGPDSLVSGVVIVVVFLVGWYVGYRVRERKKLGLPLWRSLDEEQARELASFRTWSREGRIASPSREQIAEAGRAPLRVRTPKASKTSEDSKAWGTSKASESASSKDRSRGGAQSSKRDRARRTDVERRRAEREGKS